MRRIAVYDNFTEPKHRQQINDVAARCGFAVDYYAAPKTVPLEKRDEYEVIYGMPRPSELKTFTNLKWFCGSFAGVYIFLAADFARGAHHGKRHIGARVAVRHGEYVQRIYRFTVFFQLRGG